MTCNLIVCSTAYSGWQQINMKAPHYCPIVKGIYRWSYQWIFFTKCPWCGKQLHAIKSSLYEMFHVADKSQSRKTCKIYGLDSILLKATPSRLQLCGIIKRCSCHKTVWCSTHATAWITRTDSIATRVECGAFYSVCVAIESTGSTPHPPIMYAHCLPFAAFCCGYDNDWFIRIVQGYWRVPEKQPRLIW